MLMLESPFPGHSLPQEVSMESRPSINVEQLLRAERKACSTFWGQKNTMAALDSQKPGAVYQPGASREMESKGYMCG